tara:strand:+ start:78034 stop:78609 length:576 start_codon:yes stop_codon:yes gene_type:complete
MEKTEYSIGLDISTSIVGMSLFKGDNLIKLMHVDLTKTKCMFDKASKFEEEFVQKITTDTSGNEIDIKYIYVEDTLQSFSRGLSSARTLMQLSRFNGIVSNIAFRMTKIKPVFINVNTARKTLGIKIDKNSNKDKKEQIMDWVDGDLGGYNWPTKIISRGPNKGHVKYEKFCYDIADAYVICKAGIIIKNE